MDLLINNRGELNEAGEGIELQSVSNCDALHRMLLYFYRVQGVSNEHIRKKSQGLVVKTQAEDEVKIIYQRFEISTNNAYIDLNNQERGLIYEECRD